MKHRRTPYKDRWPPHKDWKPPNEDWRTLLKLKYKKELANANINTVNLINLFACLKEFDFRSLDCFESSFLCRLVCWPSDLFLFQHGWNSTVLAVCQSEVFAIFFVCTVCNMTLLRIWSLVDLELVLGCMSGSVWVFCWEISDVELSWPVLVVVTLISFFWSESRSEISGRYPGGHNGHRGCHDGNRVLDRSKLLTIAYLPGGSSLSGLNPDQKFLVDTTVAAGIWAVRKLCISLIPYD